jgi:gluconolactonase
MQNARVMAEGLGFPEGPVAMPDGSVLLGEIVGGRLTRVSPDGEATLVAELGGSANGVAIGPDGAAYVCNSGGYPTTTLPDGSVVPVGAPGVTKPDDYIGGRIQRVDLTTGEVTDLYTECDGHPLNGPNDLVFDSHGGFWFTDHGKRYDRIEDQGVVYYALADGSSIREVVYPIHQPNGIGLSPDGARLYVAETHACRLHAYDVPAPGEIGQGRVLAAPGGVQFFDSLAVEANGNVCVATIVNAGITVVSPEGDVEHVPVPGNLSERIVTNICFGGDGLRTAYLTLSGTGRLVACDWARPGLALAY